MSESLTISPSGSGEEGGGVGDGLDRWGFGPDDHRGCSVLCVCQRALEQRDFRRIEQQLQVMACQDVNLSQDEDQDHMRAGPGSARGCSGVGGWNE